MRIRKSMGSSCGEDIVARHCQVDSQPAIDDETLVGERDAWMLGPRTNEKKSGFCYQAEVSNNIIYTLE